MKQAILYIILIAGFFASCKKEAPLTPSNLEKNWFAPTDDPSDSVTHAIYLFYEATGIPVFYKDTIGVQYGVDQLGLADTTYTTLQVDYSPLGTSGPSTGGTAQSTYFQTLSNKANVIPALNFLTANVIPLLGSTIKVKSFLLLDSLSDPAYGSYAMKGFNTVALGAVPRLSAMDQDTLNAYKAAVMTAIIGTQVLDSTAWLNAYFYSVSINLIAAQIYWAADVYDDYITLSTLQSYGFPTLQDAGFVNKNTSIDDYGDPQPPTATLDVYQYIQAVFAYTAAEFTALYGQYAPVMLKYTRMKTLLTGYGFTFN